MHQHLQNIGIKNIQDIKRYSLRKEGEVDILKIYFHKTGRELLARSTKFKFPRQQKIVSGGYKGDHFTELSEVNPALRKVVKELDELALQTTTEKEVKEQLLSDLKHLERVVTNKIKEMEDKISKL